MATKNKVIRYEVVEYIFFWEIKNTAQFRVIKENLSRSGALSLRDRLNEKERMTSVYCIVNLIRPQ